MQWNTHTHTHTNTHTLQCVREPTAVSRCIASGALFPVSVQIRQICSSNDRMITCSKMQCAVSQFS